MQLLIDKLIMIFILIVGSFYFYPKSIAVVYILIAITTTCLLNTYNFHKHKLLNIFLLSINLIIAIADPDYIFFIPLILYDFIYQKLYIASLFFFLPYISLLLSYICNHNLNSFFMYVRFANKTNTNVLFFVFIFLIYLYSILGSFRCRKINDLHMQMNQTHDTYKEKNLLLISENTTLLQQQNDEINIATLNERNRIAREIHDNVGHMLSRSILQVGALIAINKDENLKQPYLNLKSSLDEAMTNIRSSVHNLHDESIDLKQVLLNLIEQFTFCHITFDYDISEHVNRDIKYCFISICKEGLNNIMKHSNATEVSLKILEHPAFYQMILEDNGSNSNLSKNSDFLYIDGIGLQNMRSRAQTLNGTFSYNTQNGFKIHISIPKENEE